MAARRVALALAAGLMIWGPAAAQEALSPADIQRIRDSAPDCRSHPDYPWIGRVSGDSEGIAGNTIPVSFVGCFPNEGECETWKTRTSSVITTTIIQYSCRKR